MFTMLCFMVTFLSVYARNSNNKALLKTTKKFMKFMIFSMIFEFLIVIVLLLTLGF